MQLRLGTGGPYLKLVADLFLRIPFSQYTSDLLAQNHHFYSTQL